jgi:transcriptional regulator with XRE-family HTH domain
MDTTIQIIGQRIKELRMQRGLTLEEVAERSGCSSGFLSQLERNRAAPSISMLYAIGEALGVQVTDFLPDGVSATKVTRHERREHLHFEGSAISYTLLSTKFPHAALGAFLLNFKPANQGLPTDEFRAHAGEEFVHVLDGVLRLWIGDGFYDLYSGDSAYFSSTNKHRLENRSDRPVNVLAMITPSIF